MSKGNEIFGSVLQTISGQNIEKASEFNIFNKIIAFKGVKDGVGCSTIVANTALFIAEKGLKVCVIDTSILYPSQCYLLNAIGEEDTEKDKRDWYDLGMSKNTSSILKKSRYNSNIVVLGFNTDRTLLDFTSTYDCESLVTSAIESLERLYDIILIDVCSETSNIAISSMIHAHKIFQVWSDDYLIMSSIVSSIKNMLIGSVQPEKANKIIINRNIETKEKDWLSFIKTYNYDLVAILDESEVYRQKARKGVLLSKMVTKDTQINDLFKQYELILNVILGISTTELERGSFTAQDLAEGNVEGTVHKKIVEHRNEVDSVLRESLNSVPSEYREEVKKSYDEAMGIEDDLEPNIYEIKEKTTKKKSLFGKGRK